MARKRVAILISGRGSNMAALIAAADASDYPAEIVRVVADRPDAGGLAREKSLSRRDDSVPSDRGEDGRH